MEMTIRMIKIFLFFFSAVNSWEGGVKVNLIETIRQYPKICNIYFGRLPLILNYYINIIFYGWTMNIIIMISDF